MLKKRLEYIDMEKAAEVQHIEHECTAIQNKILMAQRECQLNLENMQKRLVANVIRIAGIIFTILIDVFVCKMYS